jgi:hypothetical protein
MTTKTRIRAALAIACCLLVALGIVKAQTPSTSKIQRIPIPNSDFPISPGVWVPAGSGTLYLSGNVPPVVNASAPKGSVESYGGNTEAQTVAIRHLRSHPCSAAPAAGHRAFPRLMLKTTVQLVFSCM